MMMMMHIIGHQFLLFTHIAEVKFVKDRHIGKQS